MGQTTKKIGDVGESVAKTFLQGKGYVVVEENFQRPVGEIDLIAENEELVFVEVKTVRCRIPEDLPEDGVDNYRPEEQVGQLKRERLRRIIGIYLQNREVAGDWRVDLLCVYLDSSRKDARVKWLKNIII